MGILKEKLSAAAKSLQHQCISFLANVCFGISIEMAIVMMTFVTQILVTQLLGIDIFYQHHIIHQASDYNNLQFLPTSTEL